MLYIYKVISSCPDIGIICRNALYSNSPWDIIQKRRARAHIVLWICLTLLGKESIWVVEEKQALKYTVRSKYRVKFSKVFSSCMEETGKSLSKFHDNPKNLFDITTIGSEDEMF